jgi:Mn2+/Fe2+ NRAMP family transporter
VLEKIFTSLVLLMSLSFLLTAVLTKPDLLELVKGLFIPELKGEELLTVVALIGTTVVPYNLFLYSSLVNEKWKTIGSISLMRTDILLSVLVGGLVSMAIVITAAGSGVESVQGVMELARGLEPVYGRMARYGIGVGLFAAGITSAITAPLAAAFVARQCFGWPEDRKDWKFRLIWMLVLGVGVGTLSLDVRPLQVIFTAQVANGILLPVVAFFLWWAINQASLMRGYANSRLQNLWTFLVLALVTFLSIWSIFRILTDAF